MHIIAEDSIGARLDQFLAAQLPELSRARIQALIKAGDVTVNGKTTKAKTPVELGMRIEINIPEPEPAEAQPQDIPISVLYEDKDVIVIDKESGMVVHPAAGNPDGTLVNAVLFHCGDLSGIGGVERPGIVHRLDKDTSGCIVVAKMTPHTSPSPHNFRERYLQNLSCRGTGLPEGAGRNHFHQHRPPPGQPPQDGCREPRLR